MSASQTFHGREPTDLPIEEIDWSHRGDYIRSRSARKPGDFNVEPEWATEAAVDEERIVAAPDPASKSGETIRVVGYSESANRVLVVILLPVNLPQIDGSWIGVNAWTANSTAMRAYHQREG
ncbi:transposase [Haloactinopolyspora alba]|uniref:transposase n=1 Tax=Haloactinopolyspora alba TaxID=648780 RepID=UPI000D0C9834|nr:transposase [Haloactinopolyspora alba]